MNHIILKVEPNMKSCFRYNSLARCLTIITVHPWVWLLQLTLDMWKVDRGGLELMSLWVRSGVLRIAKNSCRSNSARYPLFNTLDNSMPIDFNNFSINVQKNLKTLCFTEKTNILRDCSSFKRSNSENICWMAVYTPRLINPLLKAWRWSSI